MNNANTERKLLVAPKFKINRRTKTIFTLTTASVILMAILIAGIVMNEDAYGTSFISKNLPPSIGHLFGTDWMGRDMLARTVKGLSTSILIGAVASVFASVMALIMGIAAGTMGHKVDAFFNWLVDLFVGVPHLILLILISVLVGKGTKGVLIGVVVTHWCSLGRIIRAEILSLKNSEYVITAEKFGKSKFYIAKNHFLPHVIPQFFISIILLFPHAIMHEASITFLGFGIPPEQPAVGVILSEAMNYLTSGMWWLAVLPGLSLLLIVILFETIGDQLKLLMDPHSAQE